MFTRRQMMFGGAVFTGRIMLDPTCVRAQPEVDFQADFAAIEAKTGGRLGVMLLEHSSGRQLSYRIDERFPMCSTSKVLVCAAVLARVDRGQESLERQIRFTPSELTSYSPATKNHVDSVGMSVASLCQAAITLSDNTAMNLLIASLGGPAQVTTFARSIGDFTSRLDRTEPTLNEATPGDPRDTTTPRAMATSLTELLLGSALSLGSRRSLAAWMVASTTGNAKLRAGVPATWQVGDKTGTGDHGTSNDIAMFWRQHLSPICAVVYLTGAASVPEIVRAAASADVGRIAGRAFKG